MAYTSNVHDNAQTLNLLGTPASPLTIPAAGTTTSTPVTRLQGCKSLTVQANFAYGSAGTSVDIYVQTSLDQGLTWVDIIEFNFLLAAARKVSAVNTYLTAGTAPVAATDGSLASNTLVNGILGDRFRVKMTVVGAYAGASSIAVTAFAKG